MKKSLWKRILSGLLCFLLIFQTMGMSLVYAADSQPNYNDALVEYLTSIYGEEGAQQILDSLYDMGLIDAYGNFRTYSVVFNGKELTTAELKELLDDPNTDLSQTCTVDGEEITLQDLKTIMQIEEELASLMKYYNSDVELTAEHEAALQSLIAQLQANGLSLQLEDSEEKDNAALALGYKSQLARIQVSSTDLTVANGGTATVTFTLTKELPYAVSFDYTTVDGAAKAGENYTATSGTVTFAAGETSKSISVKINNHASNSTDYANDRWEGQRVFVIQYSNAKNILFNNGKTTAHTIVRITGNYDYNEKLLTHSIFSSTTTYGVTNINEVSDKQIVDAGGNQGNTQYIHVEKDGDKTSTSRNYASFYLNPSNQMKDLANEGIVSSIEWMVAFCTNCGGGNYGRMYICVPGMNSKTPSNILLQKEGTFAGTQYGTGDWGTLSYNLKDATNKNNFTKSGASISFALWARDVEAGNSPWTDSNGNPVPNRSEAHVQLYFADAGNPTVQSVEIPNRTFNPGEIVPITVRYSEPVCGKNAKIVLNDGTEISAAEASNTWSYSYTYLYEVKEADTESLTVSRAYGAVDMAGKEQTAKTCSVNASLGGIEKTLAFSGISLDATSFYAGTNEATLTVAIDTEYSLWLEQEENGVKNSDFVKASVDGGKTFIDLELINEGANLQCKIPLEQFTDGKDHEFRVELYINRSFDESKADCTCIFRKYVDYVVHPVVFVEAEDVTINYPTKWPSEKEYMVYLTADQTTTLGYSYNGDATTKDFAWSSNDESVAKIDPATGAIYPVAPGTVTFRLTALNGNADPTQNVYIETKAITIYPGGDPTVTIPGDMNTIVITQGEQAVVRWSTNIIYKNQTDYTPARDTDFTVKLYAGNLTAEQAASTTPQATYTYATNSELRNATDFTIPSDQLKTISVNDVPSYTVVVEVKHPESDTVLKAYAYIRVNSQAAVVRLEPISSEYLLDTIGQLTLNWNMMHFDVPNEGQFEFSVSRNDTVVDGSAVTFANGKFSSDSVTSHGDAAYSGTYKLPIADVPDGTLYDVYTVNIKAKNRSSSTWSYDSFAFYVYNENALQIIIDGKKEDQYLLSNIAEISGMSSDEILALNRNINLRKTISINYSDYAWRQVSDKISWAVENSDFASINYSQGGKYDNIENYSYTTYRPSQEFILSGDKNGTTIIKATHAATGMTDTVEVTVETLKDKLYIFQTFPKVTAEVTYQTVDASGNTVKKTVTTNSQGEVAVYEENGIVSHVSFKAVSGGTTYMGTILNGDLQSGEVPIPGVGQYPVNNIKLREAAKVTFYLKTPDGNPYTGSVTYRGGAYKNGSYCDASTTNMDGTTVDLGTDGKLVIYMDVTKLWIDGKESPYTELKASDDIKFMFELLFANDKYYPLVLSQSTSIGTDKLMRSAEMVVSLEESNGKKAPFVASQTYTDNGYSAIDVRNYTKKLGPNADYPNATLDTTILWWGVDNAELKDASASIVDEYGVVPSSQSYKTMLYPFSTIMTTVNTLPINESSMWMENGETRDLSLQLKKNGTTVYKTVSIPFDIINMLGTASVIDKDSGTMTIVTTLKNIMNGSTMVMDTNDSFIGAGLDVLSNTGFSTDVFTLQISATKDPTVYNVLIRAGYGNMDSLTLDGGKDDGEDDGFDSDLSYKDRLSMLKGDYLEKQEAELQKNASKVKNSNKELYYELSGYYEGQIVYDFEDRQWESIVHSGGITAGGGFGYSWTFNSWLGPIPVTAEIGLGAAVSVEFEVQASYEEQVYNGVVQKWSSDVDSEYVTDYLSTLRVYAYLNAFGGIGFDYSIIALKIGVFGEIAFDSQNSWLTRNYLADASQRTLSGQSITMQGRIGIRFYAKFLFISYEKILTSYTYTKTWVFNNWNKICDYWYRTTNTSVTAANMMTAIDTYAAATMSLDAVSDTVTLESRDYLDTFPRSWGSEGIQTFALDRNNGAPKTLQTNAYPYSYPQIADDGSIFVYVSDAESTDVEDTVASWAKLENGSYVDMGAIPSDIDGCGDSGLKFAGNSKFGAAVWVQQSGSLEKDAGDELTESEQALMANSSEIMVSRLVNGQWQTEKLTNDATPDLAPAVAVNGDTIFVAWRSVYIKNQSNITNYTGSEAILYQVYKDGKWSEPDTLYNGTSGTVMALEATMLEDGTAAITYTLNKGTADQAAGISTAASVQHTTEDYEIVYAVVDTESGDVRKNQQLTTNDELDENPQITTVVIDEEEYFVLGWYSVSYKLRDGSATEEAVSDIRLAIIDDQGNIKTAEVGFVDSLTTAVGDDNVDVSADYRFVRSESRDLDDLSLIWTTAEAEDTESNETSISNDALKAVRFVQDGYQVYISEVIDVATMVEGAQIDSFDAYCAGNETVKAIILGTQATGEVLDTGETTQEIESIDDSGNITYKTVPVVVPETVSGMYTATETYSNEITVISIDADLNNMVKGLSLPVKFTVENDGIRIIDKVEITLDGKTATFDSTMIRLQPNRHSEITVGYAVPEGEVVNPDYTVTAYFTDGTTNSVSDTLYLAIPDVGISDVTTTRESDGIREFTVTLYNDSEVDLTGSDYSVKLGVYADSAYTSTLLEEITISNSEDLTAIDEGAYVKKYSFNILEHIQGLDYTEIPESGIPLYIKAWIVEDGNTVNEYDSTNNTVLNQFYTLQKDSDGTRFKAEGEITNDTATTATITIQNLTMQQITSANAVVNLLDNMGNVIESVYLADNSEKLLSFGPEEIKTQEVKFTKLGASVQVVPYAVSADTMNANLTDLSVDGFGFAFDSEKMEYTVQAENKTNTNITAVAKDSGATITIRDKDGKAIATDTGSAVVTIPLAYTSINGGAISGVQNNYTIEVQPSGDGAKPQTYSLTLNNNQVSSGTVSIAPPAANNGSWVNSETATPQIVISASELNNFSFAKLEYSLDGGTTWLDTTESSITVDLSEDKIYDVRARAVSAEDAKIAANPAIINVDRTAPVVGDEIKLEKTDLPLEQANVFSRILGTFGVASGKQVKITATVSDNLSGVNSVVAVTADGVTYTLQSNGDGTYSGMITRAYEGKLTVIGTDNAGNSSNGVYSDEVLINDNMAAPEMKLEYGDTTENSIKLTGAVAFEKDSYFNEAKLLYKESGDTEWTTLETFSKAEQAKVIEETVKKLDPATTYEFRLVATDVTEGASSIKDIQATTRYAVPAAPELDSKTSYTITLKAVEGVQYRCLIDAENDTWTAWQSSPVFEGLTSNTEYTFEAKIPASGGVPESFASTAKFTTYPLYMILFDKNTEDAVSDVPSFQDVGYAEKVTEPAAEPYRAGYTFTGWYTDKECTVKFDFATEIKEVTRIYAGWSENLITESDYTITGDASGDWYSSNVVITPAGDYVAIWDGEQWSESYTIEEGKAQEINFKLGKMVDGEFVETTFLHNPLSISVDTSSPKAQITVRENGWSEFLNNVSFGLFAKETTDVVITVDDSDIGSGVTKVEYLMSDSAFATVEDITGDWTEFDKTGNGEYKFSILPNEKAYIYVRATDAVGNVTIVNSEGIVVYTDAAQNTERIEFIKPSEADVTFSVNLNGNTIDAVYVGQTKLTEENYTISEDGSMVTISADYLQTLALGTYEIRVTYKPMGETYKDGTDNAAPNATTVELTISKKAESPQTGDSSNIGLYVGLLVFSMLAIAVIVIFDRKNRHKPKYVRK